MQEWRTGKRAKRIRSEFKGRYLCVLLGPQAGTVFTPGPVEGGEPVPSEGLARVLVDALLNAPAKAGRRKRYTLPKRVARPAPEADADAPRRWTASSRTKARIPVHLTLEEANRLTNELRGDESEWRSKKHGYERDGLGAEFVDAYRTVLADEWDAEVEARRGQRELGRRPTWTCSALPIRRGRAVKLLFKNLVQARGNE